MSDRIVVHFLSFLLAYVVVLSPSAHAKRMYRWTDDNGRMYLSDKVPPDQSKHRREKLSERGRVVEVTEKAKSKEQIALDKRLAALRKAQEAIIAKQKVNDKVLLSAFRSLEDMQESLRKKMMAMDSQLLLLENNRERAVTELENHLKRAATYERGGEKIPPSLINDIDKAKAQIESVKAEIDKQESKKQDVKIAFEADIERYKFLTHSKTEAPQELSDKTAEMKAAVELGLFMCESPAQCVKAWERAHQFVSVHSPAPLVIDNEKLLMTAEPQQDSDLSLSVSKIDMGNQQQQLFLDIHCRQSTAGDDLCNSAQVHDIRTSFRKFIESGVTDSD